jgi:hypothetical protein
LSEGAAVEQLPRTKSKFSPSVRAGSITRPDAASPVRVVLRFNDKARKHEGMKRRLTVRIASACAGPLTLLATLLCLAPAQAQAQATPTFSVADVTATEGSAGAPDTATFKVTLSAASTGATTVGYATAPGTATSPADFVAKSGTLTFPAGDTEKTVDVTLVGDATDEPDERFTLNLTAVTSQPAVGDGVGEATILNDDATFSVADTTAPEGSAATPGTATFKVTLSTASLGVTTVDYTTATGTATSPADFEAKSGSLTFPAGETERTVAVPLVGDAADEPDELFVLRLTAAPSQPAVGDGEGQATIVNDDATFSVDDVTVLEKSGTTSTATFGITLSNASVAQRQVSYATADGTATAPADYQAKSGILTFAPGEIRKTIDVVIVGDLLDEDAEDLKLQLTAMVGVGPAVSDGEGIATITDDDATPSFSVANVAVTEGTGAPVAASFTVSLSAASGRTTTVGYATADGTATAPDDYTAASGTLTFAPGEITKTVDVSIIGDTKAEPSETLKLLLTAITGEPTVTDADGDGDATITDDDPRFSVDDVTVDEGTGGTPVKATFTVTLSSALTTTVQVDYATEDASATSPGDYTATSGTLTFAPGDVSKTVEVTIAPDSLDENAETFLLRLTRTADGPGVTDGLGVGTITDDDLTFSVSDTTVTEGTGSTPNLATFTVTLSGASQQATQVKYSTANGTAESPADYAALSNQTLDFPAGVTQKTVQVAIAGDGVDENQEDLLLQLAAVPGNPAVTDGQGVATIIDDDDPPTLSVGDASVVEGTGSNRFLVFTVSLSAPSSKFVTVDYDTLAGSATEVVAAGSETAGDYTARQGTLNLSPGLEAITVSVSIRADADDETDETLQLRLKNNSVSPVNATVLDGSGLGTIIDDDGPTIAIGDTKVDEGTTGATTDATLTVTLSAPSPQPVTVSFASSDDSATAGQDYTALAAGQSLTIPANQTTRTITTVVKGDDLDENDEKYRVTLTNPVNATVGDGVGVVEVTDDDDSPTVQVSGVTVPEGTGGTTNATLTVKLSAPSGRTLLAGYATQDKTAVAGVDYQQGAELLTFNPGETSKTITIPIAPDAEIEEDETFEVIVFNAASTADQVQPVTVTITDDDLNDSNKPQLSIDDVVIGLEGDTGAVNPAVFTVSMDRTLARVVTVAYKTVPGTATSPEDFTPAAGTLTFVPGERTKTIAVSTLGDTLLEFNQDFTIELADPVNAKLLDGSGQGIITDDDAGGGLLTIGLKTAPLPLEKIKLRDLMCAKGTKKKPAKCAGVRVAWSVESAGSIGVTVTAVQPRGKAKVAPTFKLFALTRKLPKAGSKGSLRAKLAAGKKTEALVKRLRVKKVRLVRVTLTFTNRFGGRQGVVEELRLTK